jgi:serine/threonine protein kinase
MGGRIALLIGTGSFGVDALQELHTPATDVRELAAVLRDRYAGGFDPVIELIDASTQQVGREIARTLDRCRRDDLVLLYFSGHALLDDEGQLHLAMHDSEPDLLSTTSISAAFIAAEFDRSRSRRQVVILDCRSGSGFAHGAHDERPAPQPPDVQSLASAFQAEGHPRVIIAGRKEPETLEQRSRPGSAFTEALVSGLRGAADSDGDGRISIDDLYEYVAAQQPAARAGNAVGSLLIANATPRSSVPARAPTAPRGPKPGSLISDRYRIVSLLAERGSGVLCAAFDERSGLPVSIKCLRPPQSSESGTLERFLREAEVMRAIEHPNLPAIYDVGFERSTAFIVMEPLPGESLATLLRRQRRLSTREALEIVMQAMAAISAAHAQRVVHRDLNPEHIFVGRAADGRVAQVKVLGFGASALLDDTDLARTGGLIGSPHYMAPEQVLGNEPPDVRADVYAFGVILYEALSGRRPFEADNHGALLFKICGEDPPPPSTWTPELPPALEAIVRKAMARDRTRRFADVENLRLTLYDSGVEHGWIRASMPPPIAAVMPLQARFVPKINTPLVFDRPPSSTLAPRPRRWPLVLGLGAAVVAGSAVWLLSARYVSLPGSSTTPLVQPRAAEPPAPIPQPIAAKPEPAAAPESEPASVAGSPAAEPVQPPSAAATPATAEPTAAPAAQAEAEAGGWRARVQARAAERRAAREASARERAEAAAAAAEARAEAAATAAAIRAATRAANKPQSPEQDAGAPKPRLKVQALPDELPELKPAPQPGAAEPEALPAPPPAEGPKPQPPPAPTE